MAPRRSTKKQKVVFEPQVHNFRTNRHVRGQQQLQPIRWDTNGGMPSEKAVDKNAYEVRITDKTGSSLLKHFEREGIVDEARRLTAGGEPLAVGQEIMVSFGDSTYILQRHDNCRNSDMHWLTPADELTNQELLQILGDSGFDDTLKAIGSSLDLDGLVVLQFSIIFVSSCEEGKIHYDTSETDDKAFTAIVPIILPPSQTPELKILDENDNSKVGGYKYTHDVAVLLGDDVKHATAKADYSGKGDFRMMATLIVADVTRENVEGIMDSYSQDTFRPDPLTLAGTHWKKDDKSVKLPRSQEQNDGIERSIELGNVS